MRSSNHYYCRGGYNLNWLLSAEIIFPKAGINFIWEIVTKTRRPIPRSYSASDFFVMPNTASRVSDALKELVKSEMASMAAALNRFSESFDMRFKAEELGRSVYRSWSGLIRHAPRTGPSDTTCADRGRSGERSTFGRT
jgi:hypothetical protein